MIGRRSASGVARLACAVLAGFTLAGAAQADAATAQEFSAPDHRLRAVVTAGARGESRVEVREGARLVARRSFESADGSHGFVVQHAEWSPNSQFFVFTLASSGGHQPWRYPAFAYSRRTHQLGALDNRIGALADPQFRLSPPDVLGAWVTKGGGPAVEVRMSLGRPTPAKGGRVQPAL